MKYRLRYHQLVVSQDIPKLDGVVKARLRQNIEHKLIAYPEIFGLPLRYSLQGHRKLRVGDYRVIYRVEGQAVIILAILHRSVVYDRAAKRLSS